MKKNLHILMLAIALIVTQACGSKSEKDNKAVMAETPHTKKVVVLTLAEKRAAHEKRKAEREEKRKAEFEELTKTTPTYTDAEGNVVYNKAETNPSFNGGNDALRKYLHDNLNYPEEAQENEIEGTVFVDFVVGSNGNVRDVAVTDATSEEADQTFRAEAIRVVTGMPKWVAGRQHGKAVHVKYSVPITFQML